MVREYFLNPVKLGWAFQKFGKVCHLWLTNLRIVKRMPLDGFQFSFDFLYRFLFRLIDTLRLVKHQVLLNLIMGSFLFFLLPAMDDRARFFLILYNHAWMTHLWRVLHILLEINGGHLAKPLLCFLLNRLWFRMREKVFGVLRRLLLNRDEGVLLRTELWLLGDVWYAHWVVALALDIYDAGWRVKIMRLLAVQSRSPWLRR